MRFFNFSPLGLKFSLDQTLFLSFIAALCFLPFSIALLETFLAISFILLFFKKILYREPLTRDKSVFIITGLFIIWCSISAFSSGYPSQSMRGIIKIIRYALIMFVTIDVFWEKGRQKCLVGLFLVTTLIVLLDALYQHFFEVDLIRNFVIFHSDSNIRLTGPFKSYGLLAAYLIAVIPLFFSLMLWMVRKKVNLVIKICFILYFSLAVFILYKSHSRGAWLALFLSLVFYALLNRNKWLMVSLFMAALSAPFLLPRNALLHLDKFSQEQTIIERNLLWSRAVQVIQAKPLFGCGINTFTLNYHKYVRDGWRLFDLKADPKNYDYQDVEQGWSIPGHDVQLPKYQAHNGYLQVAAESGIPALILLLLLIGKALTSGFRSLRESPNEDHLFISALLCGFTSLLIHACVDTTLHNTQSATLIWFYMGLLYSLRNQKDRFNP